MNTKKWESIISASPSNFSLTRRGRFLRWKTLGNVSGQQQGGRGSYYAAAWVFQCVHEIRARLCWRENRVEGGEKKKKGNDDVEEESTEVCSLPGQTAVWPDSTKGFPIMMTRWASVSKNESLARCITVRNATVFQKKKKKKK